MDESSEMFSPDSAPRESGAATGAKDATDATGATDLSGFVPLDGYFERRGFSALWTAFAALIGGFVLFQLIITPLALSALMVMQGVGLEALAADPAQVVAEHANLFLVANTIGQALGLCLPAWWLARMHTHRPLAFLRVRRMDWSFALPAAVAFVALLPVVQWLTVVNEALPLPEFIRAFEDAQLELIQQVLHVDTNLAFQLGVLALTPALCEELFFRGYVQRQAERGLGSAGGVLFSGVVFALYHLRFSQALPLAALGVFMAYLVWRTGSIWPAVGVHFANNALAVAMGAYVARHPALEITDIEEIAVPWYLAGMGAFLCILCVLAIERRAAAGGGNPTVPETLPGFLRE